MTIACVLVHYHSPELARCAVASVESDAVAHDIDTEIVVIDNGSNDAERQLLDEIPARLLCPDSNLGYAAALNLGISQTSAPLLLLMNADVEVIPGCVRHLTTALEAGAAAVGPRLYLDRNKQLVLPPLEQHTRTADLLRRLANGGDPWACWARQRWRRHARRHWLSDRALASPWLNGALLAIRRDAWDTVGPFDEGYKLYYEEIDWLLRLRRYGLQAAYLPNAEAFHWYNRSAAHEPEAKKWFTESSRRFAERHYGRVFLAVAGTLIRARNRTAGEVQATEDIPSIVLPDRDRRVHSPLWVELAPSPMRFPGAATRVDEFRGGERWRLDHDVWLNLEPGRYALTLVDSRGSELGFVEFVRSRADTEARRA